MKSRIVISFTCILMLVGSYTVHAQVNGRITGKVLDQTGGAIPSASVNLLMPGSTDPLLKTVTTSSGLFNLPSVLPGYYNLVVEAANFQSCEIKAVKVDPAQETAVPPVTLYLKPLVVKVEVTESVQPLQTENAEIATIITNEQVRRLPAAQRYPLNLLSTQAGVSTGAGPTVINGQRPSFVNVTLDGINISDNYIRSSFNFTPNLIELDQIEEFTLVTSNAGSSMGGGSSQVVFSTPSGTNVYHGTAYFYNNNGALSANSWFNNQDSISKPDFNQNQIGFAMGGPIIKDKLYFYANYEAYRYGTEIAANRTILTEDARQGIFTYEDLEGTVQKVDILEAAGVSRDPVMEQLLARVPGPENINNFRQGDSRESLLKNTAGYSFLLDGYHDRDNITAKIDYKLSTAHVFALTLLWNRQDTTRSDLSNDYSLVPKVHYKDNGKLFSIGWRWNVTPQFTNELRGGFNLAPIAFRSNENLGDFVISNMIYSNPVNTFRTQGRNTNTYNLSDNAVHLRGNHILKFGFQTGQVRVETYDEGSNSNGYNYGIVPTYFVGIGFGNPGLS